MTVNLSEGVYLVKGYTGTTYETKNSFGSVLSLLTETSLLAWGRVLTLLYLNERTSEVVNDLSPVQYKLKRPDTGITCRRI